MVWKLFSPRLNKPFRTSVTCTDVCPDTLDPLIYSIRGLLSIIKLSTPGGIDEGNEHVWWNVGVPDTGSQCLCHSWNQPILFYLTFGARNTTYQMYCSYRFITGDVYSTQVGWSSLDYIKLALTIGLCCKPKPLEKDCFLCSGHIKLSSSFFKDIFSRAFLLY